MTGTYHFQQMDWPWGHYAKWNRSDSNDRYCAASLYVERERRMVTAWGKQGEIGKSMQVVSNSLGSHGLYSPWNSPRQNPGVGSLSLLQQIFPTQESNRGLPHCSWILYQLSYQGSPEGCKLSVIRAIKSEDLSLADNKILTVVMIILYCITEIWQRSLVGYNPWGHKESDTA